MIKHKKIVLTGASGWFGHSFIAQYVATFGPGSLSQLTLVTSDGRDIVHPDVPFPLKTLSMHDATALQHRDVIIQAGFPSRDKINTMGPNLYEKNCTDILKNLKLIIKHNRLANVYLISSGAIYNDTSLYGRYKRYEEEVVKQFASNSHYIFRIFTATTKYIDYRPWSAICNFMKCRLTGQDIKIESHEEILRGIVCMQDLSDLIFKIDDNFPEFPTTSRIYDAVSHVTSIRQLAELCAADQVRTVLPSNYDRTKINSKYAGRPDQFRLLTNAHQLKLKSPLLQIKNCYTTPSKLTFN